MSRHTLVRALLIVLVLLCPSMARCVPDEPVPAEAEAATTATAPVERITVTATRFETPLERTGATVTVISRDELERGRFRTVEEALREVAGVTVLRSGSPGATTSVAIRGARGSQIQVLIDGVRVKSPTSGLAEFADLTVDNIERIEVLRGPQSTLYGADAIGGVVSVITRRGKGPAAGTIAAAGGNYGVRQGRAEAAGGKDRLDWSVGVSRFDGDGQFDNDAFGQTTVATRVGIALPGNGRLSLAGRFLTNDQGIPFKNVFPNFDPNRGERDDSRLGSLAWTQPGARWDSDLVLSGYDDRLEFSDPADPGTGQSPVRSLIRVRRVGAEWYNRVRPGERMTLTLGGEWRREDGDNRGVFDASAETRALVVQDEVRLTDRLFLTAGVRLDDHSAFGRATTPRLALSYVPPGPAARLKASWAEGFRAPTLNELFFPGSGGCPDFGNPDLEPETSRSVDLGYERRFFGHRLGAEITLFQNDFHHLIQFALVDPVNFCFQARNVGRARSRGVELGISLSIPAGWRLGIAYTYQDTDDLDTGSELRRFPASRVVATASWAGPKDTDLHARLTAQSSHFEGSGLPRTGGYVTLDLGGRRDLLRLRGGSAGLRFFADVRNALDKEYEEVRGFPALGRNYLAGLEVRY